MLFSGVARIVYNHPMRNRSGKIDEKRIASTEEREAPCH